LQVEEWERLLAAWEADISKPNPYISKSTQGNFSYKCCDHELTFYLKYSVNETWVKLAKEDLTALKAAEIARSGSAAITVQEVGPSAFILLGLELEVMQYVLLVILTGFSSDMSSH
jgi:hypothetical protein